MINVPRRNIKREIEDPMSNIPTTNQEQLFSIDSARDGCTNAPTKVVSLDDQIDGFRNIPIIIEEATEKQESESENIQPTIHQSIIQMDNTFDILKVNREIFDTEKSKEIITALDQTRCYESNLEECVEDNPGMNSLRNLIVKKDNVNILNPKHETTLLHEDETRRDLQGGREISDEKSITEKLHEINAEKKYPWSHRDHGPT